jgi:branched-chain amino acid aminotransferase
MEISITKTQASTIDQVDFENIVFGKVYADHMYRSDFKEGSYSSGRITPFEPIRVSPGNATLHYGQSVFEGMKAYRMQDGKIGIFRPDQNFKRINRSAERMCIPQLTEEHFMRALTTLIDLDRDWVPSAPGTSLYVRPFIFATDEYIGIRPSSNYSFMIFTCPVGKYYSEPVKVQIETKFSRAVEGGTGYAKAAGNYGGSLYPAKLAQEKGINQLVWTDAKTHSYIEESGTMNVAFIINDTLITPPAGDTILRGITRDSVLTLAKDMGIKVEERRVSVAEIVEAAKANQIQEAFGMGTAATIAPIKSITHEDVAYTLSEVKGWKHAPALLDRLDGIKYGKYEDPYGWMYKI